MYIPEISENCLKSQLEELVYIVKKIEADEDIDEENKLDLIFRFNPPATDEEISMAEKSLGVSMPKGYKEFLLFSNGTQLCGHLAEFHNISRVVSMDKWEKTPDFPSDYVMIADIIGDGEILCFSKDNGEFISYFDGREYRYKNFTEAFNDILSDIHEKVEGYIVI